VSGGRRACTVLGALSVVFDVATCRPACINMHRGRAWRMRSSAAMRDVRDRARATSAAGLPLAILSGGLFLAGLCRIVRTAFYYRFRLVGLCQLRYSARMMSIACSSRTGISCREICHTTAQSILKYLCTARLRRPQRPPRRPQVQLGQLLARQEVRDIARGHLNPALNDPRRPSPLYPGQPGGKDSAPSPLR
jgi:hypothetical protein